MKVRGYLVAASLIVLITSCGGGEPKGDNATIQEKQEAADVQGVQFAVDTTVSRVRFTGYGVGKNHPGKFKVSSGTVAVAGDKVTGGSFTIDIKSLDLEQKGGVFDSKLRPHLMSGDFFDAEKFGTAKFEISGVQPYSQNSSDSSVVAGANFTVSGNLTLKDVTKNISFPAKIDLDGNTLKARSNFIIDRTQWQMRYGNDKTLGDKFIDEKVNIELDLEAKKQ
jgi:polyisoprenoid-binding protein YceI